MSQPFIVIMGVSGCGKTTIASRLANALGGTYLEGDSFHPPENKARMGQGIPLNDDDRWPWFDILIAAAKETLQDGQTPVLSCSALKQAYRDYLFASFENFRLIFLEGSFELIKSRMDARDHEYMTSDLLRSQFETLEDPEPSENMLTLSIEKTPEEILAEIRQWLG
ncbi:MAG: gluconokinase [Verrucomicrobiales bacterium]|jgi:gluconokinase|nr:gluconokinase [Verrucomicrobiales bacterium]